jgi:hypothetical protein
VNLTENNQIESFGTPSEEIEYPKDVYFGAYDSTGLGIDYDLLKLYLDGNRTNFAFNTIRNEITHVQVKDYFDTVLFDKYVNFSGLYEYNIQIDLYSLRIKNGAEKTTNYTLHTTGTSISDSILSGEVIQYNLGPENYTFEWLNHENNETNAISINLNENKVYTLNSTYHEVYFGLYNVHSLVKQHEVKFYINGTRRDFGFNTLKTDDVHLQVFDYFNNTLYNKTKNLEDKKEFNILIEVYTLIIQNKYKDTSLIVNITKGPITIQEIIEPQGNIKLKLFKGTEYNITSYINQTIKDESKTVKLDEDMKTVSFGFYEKDVPMDPEPFITNIQTILIGFITAVVIVVIIITIYAYWRVRSIKKDKSAKKDIPRIKGKKKDRKKSAYAVDNRPI